MGEALGVYQHAYTHFKVTLTAFDCRLTGVEPQALEASELAWVKPAELANYPMGNIDRRISKDLAGKKILTTKTAKDAKNPKD